ncbi:pre-sequence protease. Metallo peptidase. MEROPS family M16C [Desulfacinum hydrothermale DSM 13146]|uniref:Pre-sequence protease. Metallo peptidase. MEROPS family M16C n=1 Tax=Desulfacinum hydrothermale DSM 13146 TaxID=1121390 RepID=A0A1W1XJC6_9BACT|nr:insulinase family protein [Desulfacinum hydrothermale]SMC24090.1 pre-sequence protease. Metallo peptidase. MEROPS family M16C [Desulfacinum hydrothermale DSM 13146]
MSWSQAFERLEHAVIDEIRTKATIYRHKATGARVLSMENDDENKVFGVTFRTPPQDATGLPHILEHSVLCGSRKYPVKEPFVELLKGSLQTFLNAFTYPDKTCYPVASQNHQDFYNLIDVYLDAVFYPRITPWIFKQEGWHYELDSPQAPLTYKGVVYNEMRGAYSSPDRLVIEYAQHSLFPDTPYGVDSGGDPKVIPSLTYEQFKAFHETFYHPSNAWFFFYGDDDPNRRLQILEEYLKDFQARRVNSAIPRQAPFPEPKRLSRTYAAGEAETAKSFVTVNWLLPETEPPELNLSLHILEYALLGMPASPLRKALIDSGLGEDLCGVGLEGELRQMMFSTGLRGVSPDATDKVEPLILDTLQDLARNGIARETVEAAVNTVEFRLRENNTGSYPRGLALMLRSLSTWLYDGNPLSLIAFEKPLEEAKRKILEMPGYLEGLLQTHWLENPHRTTLILEPDAELERRREEEESRRLQAIKESLSPEQIQQIVEETRLLREMQQKPDPPEALATIPRLRLEDLDPKNKTIPAQEGRLAGVPVLTHDLFTGGILYLDLGFDLKGVPQRLLPYVPLFARALLEMGTEEEDYVSLTQRISRTTGGIFTQVSTSAFADGRQFGAWLFVRGKAMVRQASDLCRILRDVLTSIRLDNRPRFKQMVLESKARREARLIPEGHRFVSRRLKASLHPADWVLEKMKGVDSIHFVRNLADRVDSSWPQVLADLEELRRSLLDRSRLRVNVTLDEAAWRSTASVVEELLEAVPDRRGPDASWNPELLPAHEGLTVPAQVHYVAKGACLASHGFHFHGSALVVSHFLRTAWLWDQIRVQGGAYGAFTQLDRFSGNLAFVSYRDPNLEKTLEVYDRTADFLRNLDLSVEELTKSVIGVIGDLDRHLLPDAKGFTSFIRHLTGDDDERRQQLRQEVLATSPEDFRRFADAVEVLRQEGRVAILGPEDGLRRLGERLTITRVL